MKKIFLFVVLIAGAFIQKSQAQDSTNQKQLTQLLNHYYQVKDALISGNSAKASLQAEAFLRTANGISNREISEENRNALVKDAGIISETKDINKQRSVFSILSTNMYALAKALKLTEDPIYYQYCPMKKTYWLSPDKTVKNPYYGSAMLTCGKVTETL